MKACFDNFCRSEESMRLHCEFDIFVGAPADMRCCIFLCHTLLYCKILYCIVSSYCSLFFVFYLSVFSAYVANKRLH